MAKFMRTIADVRSGLRRESLSTKPLLTNDYTYGNKDVQKSIINSKNIKEPSSDANSINSNKAKEHE